MLTETQKNCRYCHFDSYGIDFAVGEDDVLQLNRLHNGAYYIDAWADDGYHISSEDINYCPICGRKLTKETT